MEAPEGYRTVETPDDDVYYWKHKEKDVDVRIQKSGEDYDLDLIIHGVVKPVGFYKLSNAKTEAKEIMDQNPEAENIEHHTAY
jgi:hypothetical protein